MAYLAPRSVDCTLELKVDTRCTQYRHSKEAKIAGKLNMPPVYKRKAEAYGQGFMLYIKITVEIQKVIFWSSAILNSVAKLQPL